MRPGDDAESDDRAQWIYFVFRYQLNGDDYLAVPFKADSVDESSRMEIGYITRKNTALSEIGELYIKEIKQYLHLEEE